MSFYIYECYGHENWNPKIKDGQITGECVVENAFGKKAKTKIVFQEKPLEYIKLMIPGIDKIT